MSSSASVFRTVDEYLDVLRDWRIGRVLLVWLLAALAFIPYVVSARLVESGLIGEPGMMALRLPLLAVAIVFWLWALQFEVRQLVG